MNILLVRGAEIISRSSAALTTPPIGLAYLASYLLSQGHNVKIIDSVGEAIDLHTPLKNRNLWRHGLEDDAILAKIPQNFAGIIGLSCMFSQDWPLAKALLKKFREKAPDALIVAGGEHVSALPEFCLREVSALDCCICGEGEASLSALAALYDKLGTAWINEAKNIPSLVYRSASANYVVNNKSPRISNLDHLPRPAWQLVPLENYLKGGHGFGISRGRNMPIIASRGCPFACTFCSNPSMWEPKWYARSPQAVVEEMKYFKQVYDCNNFDFYDLTAIVRKDWIMEFCALLKQENLGITFQLPSGTRSEAIDKEVAQALRESGCCHLVYAPESGSAKTLQQVNKRINLNSMIRSIRGSVAAGLSVKLNIVIGFPEETKGDLFKTLLFIAKSALMGVQDIFIYPFTPYPGSKLFTQLKNQNQIPTIDDEYFYSLNSYIRLGNVPSYCQAVSPGFLSFFRIFGIIVFYLLSFIFRPWRFFSLTKNVWLGNFNTRLEAFLGKKIRQVTISRQTPEAISR